MPRVTVPRITKCEMMKHAVRPSPFNEDDDLPIAKDDNIDDATVNKDAWMQVQHLFVVVVLNLLITYV